MPANWNLRKGQGTGENGISLKEERIPPPYFIGEVGPKGSEGVAMYALEMGSCFLAHTLSASLRSAPPP